MRAMPQRPVTKGPNSQPSLGPRPDFELRTVTDRDDPNPYARPSAWPTMPSRPLSVKTTAGAEPQAPPLRTPSSTAAILSGSALPLARPAAPTPAATPEPEPAPPAPE